MNISAVSTDTWPSSDQLEYLSPLIGVFVLMSLITSMLGRLEAKHSLPPGPKGLPIVGNTNQVPDLLTWKWFQKMSKEYGPISWFRIKCDNILLLSDPKDAEELLAKRASNYSARKLSIYATHYRSNNKRMLLLSDGAEFKKQRAIFKLMFRPEALHEYEWRQEQQAKKLLFDMLTAPEQWTLNVTRYTAGVIMGIVFGAPVEGREKDLEDIMRSNETFNLDGLPGMHLVDAFPWLDHLPNVLAPWRVKALEKHQAEAGLFKRLAYDVRRRVKEGRGETCFISKAWEVQDKIGLEDLSIAYLGGSAFEAGTYVSACVLKCFILACVNWPNVVQRAQEEMREVLGEAAPTFADREKLPYMYAVVKETIRWVPVTPLAFPHMAEGNDTYKGYDIPAGTLVFPSVWNMHRNPEIFENPDVFDPMRFYMPNAGGGLSKEASLVDGHWSFG